MPTQPTTNKIGIVYQLNKTSQKRFNKAMIIVNKFLERFYKIK